MYQNIQKIIGKIIYSIERKVFLICEYILLKKPEKFMIIVF
jgi:hypothetical protein